MSTYKADTVSTIEVITRYDGILDCNLLNFRVCLKDSNGRAYALFLELAEQGKTFPVPLVAKALRDLAHKMEFRDAD